MKVLAHQVTAGHISPLRPDQKVFGSEENGYCIITEYGNGSRFWMKAKDGFALRIGSNLVPVLTSHAAELEADPSQWSYARDIWPDQYVAIDMVSPCCSATIDASRSDGVMVGSCSKCQKDVVRKNPRTGVQEWLDGQSPWTEEDLRPVMISA